MWSYLDVCRKNPGWIAAWNIVGESALVATSTIPAEHHSMAHRHLHQQHNGQHV